MFLRSSSCSDFFVSEDFVEADGDGGGVEPEDVKAHLAKPRPRPFGPPLVLSGSAAEAAKAPRNATLCGARSQTEVALGHVRPCDALCVAA